MVVSYRNSTSNHNHLVREEDQPQLYLIEILHQTTTGIQSNWYISSCILSKFYIKPQLEVQPGGQTRCCILSKFYIKPQRPREHTASTERCILSKFYIKPQRPPACAHPRSCCILSKFYIKPQLPSPHPVGLGVVSYRNSTSNHNLHHGLLVPPVVVSYRNSTSNHNFRLSVCIMCGVVSYRNSTSNHNLMTWLDDITGLYLIEILHQTTTGEQEEIHHFRCILSKFYIKPQL